MRGRTDRNGVQPHSTQNMRPVRWGSSHAVSRQKMQRMEPMLASGLLGDAGPLARWALTKYASTGCPKGSIRKTSRRTTNKNKTQKHLAPKVPRGRKQQQAKLELAGTAPPWPQWVWGGDNRGQALRLHPQPGIDP